MRTSKLKLAKFAVHKYYHNSLMLLVCLILYMYPLMVPNRIKSIGMPIMNNQRLNNYMVILFVVAVGLLLSSSLWKRINSGTLLRNQSSIFYCVVLLIYALWLVLRIGWFSSIEQGLVALLMMVLPFAAFAAGRRLRAEQMSVFLRLTILVNFIYAILTIVVNLNYNSIATLIGNPPILTGNSFPRAHMMLGSSITVAYYMNISLPIILWSLSVREKNHIWRMISAAALVTNCASVVISLSRFALLSHVVVVCVFLYVNRSRFMDRMLRSPVLLQRGVSFAVVMLIFVALMYVVSEEDFSRYFILSAKEREGPFQLGLMLFAENPVVGTGMGRYFIRVYSDPSLTINGIVGLVDPHNTLVLVLSEHGVIGAMIITYFFVKMVSLSWEHIEEATKSFAVLFIVAFSVGAMGGSQLFTEPSFAAIFYLHAAMLFVRPQESLGHTRGKIIVE